MGQYEGNPAYTANLLSQPNGGNLPSMEAIGPHDLQPGQHNPYYDVYSMSRGRHLGSLGQTPTAPAPTPPSSDAGVAPEEYMSQVQRAMKDYPNELDSLAAEDDVQGNGIFDAPDTHGNIHPDDGIFADRESLPGYLAREQFFKPSEVIDVNTGEPVMYVPGNGFMVDPRTQWAVDQISLYEPGLPTTGGTGVEQVSTVRPDQPAWSVGPVGQADNGADKKAAATNAFILAGIAGLSIGLLAGLVTGR
jgi:hypothetical protein